MTTLDTFLLPRYITGFQSIMVQEISTSSWWWRWTTGASRCKWAWKKWQILQTRKIWRLVAARTVSIEILNAWQQLLLDLQTDPEWCPNHTQQAAGPMVAGRFGRNEMRCPDRQKQQTYLQDGSIKKLSKSHEPRSDRPGLLHYLLSKLRFLGLALKLTHCLPIPTPATNLT